MRVCAGSRATRSGRAERRRRANNDNNAAPGVRTSTDGGHRFEPRPAFTASMWGWATTGELREGAHRIHTGGTSLGSSSGGFVFSRASVCPPSPPSLPGCGPHFSRNLSCRLCMLALSFESTSFPTCFSYIPSCSHSTILVCSKSQVLLAPRFPPTSPPRRLRCTHSHAVGVRCAVLRPSVRVRQAQRVLTSARTPRERGGVGGWALTEAPCRLEFPTRVRMRTWRATDSTDKTQRNRNPERRQRSALLLLMAASGFGLSRQLRVGPWKQQHRAVMCCGSGRGRGRGSHFPLGGPSS